jgi:hypothetical protein
VGPSPTKRPGSSASPLEQTSKSFSKRVIRLLKKSLVDARQGGNERKSAVYWAIHEHFEPIFNAAKRRQRVYQQPVSTKQRFFIRFPLGQYPNLPDRPVPLRAGLLFNRQLF